MKVPALINRQKIPHVFLIGIAFCCVLVIYWYMTPKSQVKNGEFDKYTSNGNLTVYVVDNCPPCQTTLKSLDDMDIYYVTKNASLNHNHRQELFSLGTGKLPFLLYNDILVKGYSAEAIDIVKDREFIKVKLVRH